MSENKYNLLMGKYIEELANMARKTRDDYIYYNVSIRNELRIFFEA